MTATSSSLTLDSLIDGLFAELAAVMHTPGLEPPKGQFKWDERKYYDYVQLYLVVLVRALEGKPTIPFPIDLANISKPLKQELALLTKPQLDAVLKGAVMKIFEDLDRDHCAIFDNAPVKCLVDFAPEVARILKVRLRMVNENKWTK